MNVGFVTMTLPNSVNERKVLSRQLINSSCTRVNKLFVAINTVKYRTEDVN